MSCFSNTGWNCPSSGNGGLTPEQESQLASVGLISGVISGGEITINGGDPAKFDLAAGTGIVINWVDPLVPVFTEVSWPEQLAITVTNIGTTIFTSLYITSLGVLTQTSGDPLPTDIRRQNIVLDAIVHNDFSTIGNVATSSIQAYEYGNAFEDYIKKLGPINADNGYSANGANLTIDKAAGTTTLPWINRDNDPQSPTTVTNASQSPVPTTTMSGTYQDGVGGFIFVPADNTMDPDLFDDGSGTLAAVANNKFTIVRFFFFGQNDNTIFSYGQAEYSSLPEAEGSIFTEAPVLSPLLSTGTFVSALIVKKGVTDLAAAVSGGDASFVAIISQTSAAAAGSGSQDLQATYDLSVSPEILTDATRGALTLRRGSAADTDNIIEGMNGAGTITFSIKGNGNLEVSGQAGSLMNTLVDAATIATDCNLGNVHQVTLGGNRTLGAPTNLISGFTYIWIFTQDNTAPRTLAYNAIFKFPNGTAPDLSIGNGDVDILTGVYDGISVHVSSLKKSS